MGCASSLLKTDADLEQMYELDRQVGEGVEGAVYLATERASGQQVAIKLVHRGEDLGLGPEKVRREIQLQARLSHVNIVELKQVVLTRRHLGLVMTFVGGGDLHAYASKFTLDETVARYYFRQIVAAVAYCHRCNIAHRDLKLGNFMLTTDRPPRVKLGDFGCARQWETKAVPQQRLGRFRTFAGTPAYMSPQVLQSAFYPTNTYDAVEADVWALGVVLCHLFFGKHTPFWLAPNAWRNEGATMQARIAAMKEQSWVDSDEFVKANITAISPDLKDLLDKIFVADEFKRITIQGIQEHPWFTGELPPMLQSALDEMEAEQELRDSLERATISLAANCHDTANPATQNFATIDLLVDLAQSRGKMPGGSGGDTVFCLDMAHIDINTIASPTSQPGSPTAAAAAGDGADAAAAFGGGSVHGSGRHGALADPSAHGSSRLVSSACASVDEDGTASGGGAEGTQHSAVSYASSLHRAASTGDRSNHYTSVSGAPQVPGGSVRKTLALHKSPSGLLVGRYVLSPAGSGGGGGGGADAGLQHAGSVPKPGLFGGGAAEKAARSVHAGQEFFSAAAAAGGGSGKRGGGGGANGAAAFENKTVHAGTANAAHRAGKGGGIFYTAEA